jgi:hypothetical protein
VKTLTSGELWPMLFMTVVGVAFIGVPFHILAQRENPIDSVGEALIVAAGFALFVSVGVYCLWAVACVVATVVLASFWWGHLKEGMRQEDVLHILGEPALKSEGRTASPGDRWHDRYPWFRLRGCVHFDANDTVSFVQEPRGKPDESWPGQFHGW